MKRMFWTQNLSIFAVFVTFGACFLGFGATIYMDKNGSNDEPYNTWAKAATTLGVAVNAGYDGDGKADIMVYDPDRRLVYPLYSIGRFFDRKPGWTACWPAHV